MAFKRRKSYGSFRRRGRFSGRRYTNRRRGYSRRKLFTTRGGIRL